MNRTSTTHALVAFMAMLVTPASAARVTFEVEVPETTPDPAEIWIAGDVAALGAWDGAGVRLAPRGARRFRATVELASGTVIEFKVTRGGWATVEKGAAGEEIGNRSWQVRGDDTLRVTVAAWRDQVETPSQRASTVSGDVRPHRAFGSQHVRARDVWVYLPPGYQADSAQRYPVLYFHDGRNVFDAASSFLGVEWGVDETAERLIGSGQLAPFIAVAVDNTPDRIDEYTPVPDARHGGGRATAYARFLIEELMPFVDRTYRTRSEAAATGVVGSSLGGIVSLYLGLAHPERFGLIGCVSPAVWWADHDIVRRAARPPTGLRIWLDVGTAEGTASADAAQWVAGGRALRDALGSRRSGPELHYEEVEGAKHDERAWAARIDRILLYLLGPPPAGGGAPGAR